VFCLNTKYFDSSGGSATSLDANGKSGYYGGASGGSIWITSQTVKIGGIKHKLGGLK
jgi:hypothetical protein